VLLDSEDKTTFDVIPSQLTPSLAARYLERKLAEFRVHPGSPEVDPMIDENKRAG